jgi:hypothetical protein
MTARVRFARAKKRPVRWTGLSAKRGTGQLTETLPEQSLVPALQTR